MSALFNMLPRASFDDVEHVRDGYPEAVRDFAIDQPFATKPTYLANVGFGQMGAPVVLASRGLPHESSAKGVAHVLFLCAPLQVFWRVIQLVSVKMIGDVLFSRLGAAKGLKNKAVDWAYFAPPVLGEARNQVPSGSHVLGDDTFSRFAQPAANPNVFSDNGPHAGVVRNFVGFFKARNRLPNFVFHPPTFAQFCCEVNTIRS